MKKIISLLVLLYSLTCLADIGKIINIIGSGVKVYRGADILSPQNETELQIDDKIESNEAIVQFLIYPSTQITISKNSVFEITDNEVAEIENSEKVFSIFNFLKGRMRVLVDKLSETQENDQVFQSAGTAFAIRGTEFELEVDDVEESTDIQVYEGTVEAKDLSDQDDKNTLQITKNEAFKRKRHAKWGRRNFKELKDLPPFERREKLKELWQKKRERIIKRVQNKREFLEKRNQRKQELKLRKVERRMERRELRQQFPNQKNNQRSHTRPQNRPQGRRR